MLSATNAGQTEHQPFAQGDATYITATLMPMPSPHSRAFICHDVGHIRTPHTEAIFSLILYFGAGYNAFLYFTYENAFMAGAHNGARHDLISRAMRARLNAAFRSPPGLRSAHRMSPHFARPDDDSNKDFSTRAPDAHFHTRPPSSRHRRYASFPLSPASHAPRREDRRSARPHMDARFRRRATTARRHIRARDMRAFRRH